jgi:hypothetical protein
MLYGKLSATKAPTRHDRGYDAKVWEELDDLFRGGYVIAAKADKYLFKCVGEDLGGSSDRYKERLKLAAYIGYFAQQCNCYGAALFERPVLVMPAGDAEDPNTPGELPDVEVYGEFARNADLRGGSFSEVLKQVTLSALVKGKGIIAVDFPALDGETPNTRAESDATGVSRPYIYEVTAEELINWRYASQVTEVVDVSEAGRTGAVRFSVGRFAWAITKKVIQEREKPEDEDGVTVEEYRVWQRQDDGSITWDLYRIEITKDKKLSPEDDIPVEKSSGATTFREIPLVEIKIPEALWLGNVLGPMCLEHYRRRSALLAAQQRALLVIPQVNLGPEVPGVGQPLPAARAQDESRGDDPRQQLERKGYMTFGVGEGVSFPSPQTAAFQIVDQQLKDLVDEIHRIAGRMASSISSTGPGGVDRSGVSKELDQADFCVVLRALGAIVRDGARRIYEIISDARQEDVHWSIHGLDEYAAGDDRQQLLAEGAALGTLPVESPTFRAEAQMRWAQRFLPGLSADTQATIRKEIAARLSGAPAGAQVFAYDLQGGVVTVNEQRADKGKPSVVWGDITQPELAARVLAGWTTDTVKGWVAPAAPQAPAFGGPPVPPPPTRGAKPPPPAPKPMPPRAGVKTATPGKPVVPATKPKAVAPASAP